MALKDFLSTSHVFLKSPICLQRYVTISPVLRPSVLRVARQKPPVLTTARSRWRFPLGGIHWFGTAAIHSFTKPSVEAAAFLVTENAGRGEELSFPHDAHIKVILETGQAFQPLACPLLLFTGQPLSLQGSR